MAVMRWMLLLALVAAAGCGGEGHGGVTPPEVCSTKSAWTGGEESGLMNPGQDCIDCHSRGEGPKFQIAGTVMGAESDDDNCNGLAGATVQITGADGVTIELTTNAAGNFYSDHSTPMVAFPFTAKVIGTNGKESKMVAAQSTGACNSCHTAAGANGAPGRITVPQ